MDEFIFGKETEHPLPALYVDMAINDKPVYSEPGHTWLRNAHNMLGMLMLFNGVAQYLPLPPYWENGKLTIRNYGADTYGVAGCTFAAVEGAVNGLMVGTSDTAWNIDQYALGGLIAHGNSAGQLYYNAQTYIACAYDAETKTYSYGIRRMYNNNHASTSVTVNEIGLSKPLYARDVLDSPIIVAAGDRLTVTYTLTSTVDVPA